jgi:deoxycytidylate deaminase/dephospho-CoA kinase
MSTTSKIKAQNGKEATHQSKELSPQSREIVIGVVGYIGSGCSVVANKIRDFLDGADFEVHTLKLSTLIGEQFKSEEKIISAEAIDGKSKLDRAKTFQNYGDELRGKFGGAAIASLAVKKIIELRGLNKPGERKIAYILDSLKHEAEVHLLRSVYGESFSLIGVHCDRSRREKRLHGEKAKTQRKFSGVPKNEFIEFLDRDEKDGKNELGQHVRDTFCLSDFFLDNNPDSMPDLLHLNNELDRLIALLTGKSIVRPKDIERAMYHAYAASLQSACLSRQVGASILSSDGRIVATGANEVPKFGGGVYSEGDQADHRCFAWEFSPDSPEKFVGCHNSRKKYELKNRAAQWFGDQAARILVEAAIRPREGYFPGIDEAAISTAIDRVKAALISNRDLFEKLPGVNDLIEFSRSIHAEMNAVLNAARGGISTVDSILLCTTFPCHNCARHLVAAGISIVYYIEPYSKSLAIELHSDAIVTEMPENWDTPDGGQNKMAVIPFSGAGPRMYEQHFLKRGELKDPETGAFKALDHGDPIKGVRLIDLKQVEERAAALTA